jgi:hypothetical protein
LYFFNFSANIRIKGHKMFKEMPVMRYLLVPALHFVFV